MPVFSEHMAGETIAARVRRRVVEVRERRGWSQAQLAERLGEILPDEKKSWARQGNISKFETTGASDLDVVGALAKALGVPLTMLVGSSEDTERFLDSLDPIAQGLHEALHHSKTGLPDRRIVLAMVNGLREMAGLELLPPRFGDAPAPEDS